jgi:hypothetical protein
MEVNLVPNQGTLTEGEGSVQLNSLSKSATFDTEKMIFLFKKTRHLHEEANCTEPSPT